MPRRADGAAVLGGSSGGILALDAAAHGIGIDRLAVYEPHLLVADSRPPLPDGYLARRTERVAAGRRGDAVELLFTDALRLPGEAIAGMRGAPFWAELEKVAPTLVYEANLIVDVLRGMPLPAARWASITVPTLVVDGGTSPAMMASGADALAALVPHGRRHRLPGDTHDVAADALAPALAEFFQ